MHILPSIKIGVFACGVTLFSCTQGVGSIGESAPVPEPTGQADARSIDDTEAEPDGGVSGEVPDAQPSSPDAAGPDYSSLTSEEQTLFDLINEERVARGMNAVMLRTDLNCAAGTHSMDIGTTGTCTHTGSDGSSPGERVGACSGPGWSGEIVACGQGTPRAAVDAWISSPGHNAIMFTNGQEYMGVAVHNNYWTAIFDQ